MSLVKVKKNGKIFELPSLVEGIILLFSGGYLATSYILNYIENRNKLFDEYDKLFKNAVGVKSKLLVIDKYINKVKEFLKKYKVLVFLDGTAKKFLINVDNLEYIKEIIDNKHPMLLLTNQERIILEYTPTIEELKEIMNKYNPKYIKLPDESDKNYYKILKKKQVDTKIYNYLKEMKVAKEKINEYNKIIKKGIKEVNTVKNSIKKKLMKK